MQTQQLSAFLQCLKQLGSTPSASTQFKFQYHSLSKNYKQAQSRILQLQSSLIQQTMHNQRQSSIIQLLKQILNGEVDDMSILGFLKSLEEDLGGDHSLELCIGEIEGMLEKRRRKGVVEKQGKIVEIGIRCEELESSVVCLAGKVKELERKIEGKDKQIELLKEQMQKQRGQKQAIESTNTQLTQEVKYLSQTLKTIKQESKNNKNQLDQQCVQIQNQKVTIQQYIQTITSCNQSWKLSQNNSKQLSIKLQTLQSVIQQLEPVLGKDRFQMKNKLSKLIRNYRYYKQKQQVKQNHKSSLCNSMKQFLSNQALKLVMEIEENISSGYLYKELEELCVLQKEKLRYYQQQQKEVRKYKLELLRLREGESMFNSKVMSAKSKCGWRERDKDLERTDSQPASTALQTLTMMGNIMQQLNSTFSATKQSLEKLQEEMRMLRRKIEKQQVEVEAEVRLKMGILRGYGEKVGKEAREQNQESVGLMKEVKMANLKNKSVLDGADGRVKRLGRKIDGQE